MLALNSIKRTDNQSNCTFIIRVQAKYYIYLFNMCYNQDEIQYNDKNWFRLFVLYTKWCNSKYCQQLCFDISSRFNIINCINWESSRSRGTKSVWLGETFRRKSVAKTSRKCLSISLKSIFCDFILGNLKP